MRPIKRYNYHLGKRTPSVTFGYEIQILGPYWGIAEHTVIELLLV